MNKSLYQIVVPSVEGSARLGWVNTTSYRHEANIVQVHHRGKTPTSEDIARTLRKKGWLPKGLQTRFLTITGDPQCFHASDDRLPRLTKGFSPDYGWKKPIVSLEFMSKRQGGKLRRRFYAYMGDVNPTDHSGGYVFRMTENGKTYYNLEWVEWNSDTSENGCLYWTPIGDSVTKDLNWVDVGVLEEYLGLEPGQWAERCASVNVVERAQCLVDAANFYGWLNIDSYPRSVTRSSMRLEWKNVGKKRKIN
jgi:hypothetical protein